MIRRIKSGQSAAAKAENNTQVRSTVECSIDYVWNPPVVQTPGGRTARNSTS
jgi:hypothetical protein